MKYLKTYNQLNESLRDKMTGISDDEVLKFLSESKPFGKIVNGIKYLKLDFVKEGFDEIDKNSLKLIDIIKIFNSIFAILVEDSDEVLEIIKYLDSIDSRLNILNKLGWGGIVEIAERYDNIRVLEYLVNKNYAEEHRLSSSLFNALQHKKYENIKILLSSKKLNPFELDGEHNESPFNSFVDSIEKGDEKILDLFLEHPKINDYYSEEELEDIKDMLKN